MARLSVTPSVINGPNARPVAQWPIAWDRHLPLILLTPFYHPGGNRVIVVGLFLLTLTAAGVLYGYLRLTSESVWPVGIAHGVYNSAWNLFSGLTVAGAAPLLLE